MKEEEGQSLSLLIPPMKESTLNLKTESVLTCTGPLPILQDPHFHSVQLQLKPIVKDRILIHAGHEDRLT